MATIDVKDAAGITVPIEKPLAPGRAAAAASRPVVLSTEDLAALAAVVDAIAAIPAGGDASAANQVTIIGALSALIGHVDGVEALLTALNGKDFATQTTLASLLAAVTKDSTGAVVSPGSYAHTMTYNVDGTIATEAFTNGSNTWTKTYTWTSGNLATETAWVRS